MANFTGLAAARAVLARAGLERRGRRPLRRAADRRWSSARRCTSTLPKALACSASAQRVWSVPADRQGRMRAARLPGARARRSSASRPATSTPARSTRYVRSARRAAQAPGCTSTARSACGRLRRRCARPLAGIELGRLVGDGRAQVAQRALRLRHRSSCGSRARRGGMPTSAATCPRARERHPFRLHARDVAPRARRRGVGGAALARAAGRSGPGRALLPPRGALRRGPAAAGYEVLNDVVLNQVLVSFGDAEATNAVIAAIQADGTCWCGGTVWQGHGDAHQRLVLGDDRRRRR